MIARKFFLVSAAIMAMISSAYAADLPSHGAPPVPPMPPTPVFTWTGFYVGVNGGYVDSQGSQIFGSPLFASTAGAPISVQSAQLNAIGATGTLPRLQGVLGGGQVGYNWQFSSFVIGVETDFDGTNLRRSSQSGSSLAGLPAPVTVNTTIFGRQNQDYIGTFRGRFGVLPWNSLLVFATGGLAYGRTSANIAIVQSTPFIAGGGLFLQPGATAITASATRVGLTGGAGFEWMFLPNWSVKAEGLYYDLRSLRADGAYTAITPSLGPPIVTTTGIRMESRSRGLIARAGINYHFNWGVSAPVVARY